MNRTRALSVFLTACFATSAFAQTPKVDFGRDVLPIFRQNCFPCHGPSVATSGLRMDRKSSVFKDGFRRVVPGSPQNSFLYHRLIGTEYGLSMPPTGKLKPEQIETIRLWIEQGADWPDKLSVEVEVAPLDPRAVAAVEILRTGDTQRFLAAIAADPKLLNARGPEGSTPFMYAALYGDAALLEKLLKLGANPNLKNDAGATALIWAAMDLEKTRLLVAHGADVNAISSDLRTPLMVAAGIANGRPIVQFLLDHGANVNPTRHPDSESSPLVQATLATDTEMLDLLVHHGANVKASGTAALSIAYEQECQKCADWWINQALAPEAYTVALQTVANFADAKTIRTLLDHGAKVDEPDGLGHTPLAYAAGSDNASPEVVKLLIDHGANVNSKSPHKNSGDTGMTVLDLAQLRGNTPVAAMLIKAGATNAISAPAAPAPSGASSARIAVERSLPLMQRADAGFTAKSGCVSCHNNSIAAMAVGLARDHGFTVDESIAHRQFEYSHANLQHSRDLLHQGYAGGGPSDDTFFVHILSYQLIGFHAEAKPADLDTDAAAIYIKSRQLPAGNWPYPTADTRPPICSDHIGQTALCLRALQLYAPKAFKADCEKAVDRAAAWLAKADTRVTEDYLGKLLGLAWAARDQAAIAKARRDVLALQRPDGGWADLPTLNSSAYSTGRALYVLATAGLPVSDPAYRRGMAYLLKNQQADGSWYVRTRAMAFQPFFESGFPHGVNQAISDAATGWSTLALILGSPAPAGTATARAADR